MQSHTTTPSVRISKKPGRRGERERENAIYSGHLRLCQQPRAAQALRSDQFSPNLLSNLCEQGPNILQILKGIFFGGGSGVIFNLFIYIISLARGWVGAQNLFPMNSLLRSGEIFNWQFFIHIFQGGGGVKVVMHTICPMITSMVLRVIEKKRKKV